MSDVINDFIKVKVPSLMKTISYGDNISNMFNMNNIMDTAMNVKKDPFHLSKKDPFQLMKVKESTIDGAGLGTFATQFIPKNTDLGKYYGKITKEMPKDTTYAWTIFNSDKFGNIFKEFVDGKDFKENNPLRYINAPKNQQEKPLLNTKMVQQEGTVHYHTTRDIYKGEELFVDYGNNYWRGRRN